MNEEQLLELDIEAEEARAIANLRVKHAELLEAFAAEAEAKASALREEARLARSRALDALGDARAKNRKTLDAEFAEYNKD